MPRYQSLGKRDANEKIVYEALRVAGADPERLTDVDIVARHALGRAVLIEVKVPGQEDALTPLQRRLKALFGEQFQVVSTAEAALAAVGRLA